jgi:hypothetical protein
MARLFGEYNFGDHLFGGGLVSEVLSDPTDRTRISLFTTRNRVGVVEPRTHVRLTDTGRRTVRVVPDA